METLGRYELLEYIGDDRPWRLYLARVAGGASPYRTSTKEVIVQLLNRAYTVDELAHVAFSIDHPNVERVLDFEAGAGFCVTELTRGVRLHHLLDACRRLEPTPALVITRQLCQALHAIHRLPGADDRPLGLSHRAVRIDRVLIKTSGEALLRNPGLELSERSSPTRLSLAPPMIVERLSPEQVVGLTPDLRSDLYQVGLLLNELLTGRSLFHRGSPYDTVAAIRDAPPEPPSRAADQIPRELDAVVVEALAKAPEDRPQSAAELDRRLEEVQSRAGLDDSTDSVIDVLERSGLQDRPRIAGLR